MAASPTTDVPYRPDRVCERRFRVWGLGFRGLGVRGSGFRV